jgi:hypothetical protein
MACSATEPRPAWAHTKQVIILAGELAEPGPIGILNSLTTAWEKHTAAPHLMQTATAGRCISKLSQQSRQFTTTVLLGPGAASSGLRTCRDFLLFRSHQPVSGSGTTALRAPAGSIALREVKPCDRPRSRRSLPSWPKFASGAARSGGDLGCSVVRTGQLSRAGASSSSSSEGNRPSVVNGWMAT